MSRARIGNWLVGLALALPAVAMAEQAYTTTAVNLRAGPDADYPLVRWVPEGTAVEVYGCLADYRWCDVEAYGDRGWMSASYLVYPYQNSNVPIVTYGAVIGLPLLAFSFDSYWHDHYRYRPWYNDRYRWAHRHRPDYVPPPYYRPPPRGYYPRDDRRPQYYPPSARPPEYRPPSPRAPEFRPPEVRPLDRQPSFRDNRTFPQAPVYRAPQDARPSAPQAVRPPAPPPARQPPSRADAWTAPDGRRTLNPRLVPDTSGAP